MKWLLQHRAALCQAGKERVIKMFKLKVLKCFFFQVLFFSVFIGCSGGFVLFWAFLKSVLEIFLGAS